MEIASEKCFQIQKWQKLQAKRDQNETCYSKWYSSRQGKFTEKWLPRYALHFQVWRINNNTSEKTVLWLCSVLVEERACITTASCGSLFSGHCPADKLLKHFHEFGPNKKLNPKYLLHLGMDRPNVTKSIESQLSISLEEKLETQSLKLAHALSTIFTILSELDS